MQRTLNIETLNQIGKEVLLKGWVSTRRDHGKLIFLDLRDRSGIVQAVVNPRISPRAWEVAEKLRPEWVVEVVGQVNKRPRSSVNPELPTGTVEIEVKKLNILAPAAELPFDLGTPTLNLNLETLLDHRPLTLRHPKIQAIFKVQEVIVQSFRKTLKELGFTEIQVPTIVASATEGGAEVFQINYFNHDAYLAQSPQLYKQIAVSAFERVFTVAHAYRAEPSVTTRHLTEYVGLDAELGFIESFEDIMRVVEQVVRDIFRAVETSCQEILKIYQVSLPKLAQAIPKVKLRQAQEIIFERTGQDHRKESDLDPEDEREICHFAKEKYSSDLIFITHYPTKKRPFYTHPDPEDPEYTFSFDLLGRGVEWVTGGQRINDYEKLLTNLGKWGLKPSQFEIYLQAFRYGMPPEGGFCLGLERVTKDILGLANIREASLFPRDMERVDIRLKNSKSGWASK